MNELLLFPIIIGCYSIGAAIRIIDGTGKIPNTLFVVTVLIFSGIGTTLYIDPVDFSDYAMIFLFSATCSAQLAMGFSDVLNIYKEDWNDWRYMWRLNIIAFLGTVLLGMYIDNHIWIAIQTVLLVLSGLSYPFIMSFLSKRIKTDIQLNRICEGINGAVVTGGSSLLLLM